MDSESGKTPEEANVMIAETEIKSNQIYLRQE